MRISKKTQYGLRAMVYLAKVFKKDKAFPLREIVKKEGISFDFLEKIISKLAKQGLIKAKKGIQGGYFLAKEPKKIKVGEIIKALEGTMAPVECLDRKVKLFCPLKKKCLTRGFWRKLEKSLNFTLNSIKLSDLTRK